MELVDRIVSTIALVAPILFGVVFLMMLGLTLMQHISGRRLRYMRRLVRETDQMSADAFARHALQARAVEELWEEIDREEKWLVEIDDTKLSGEDRDEFLAVQQSVNSMRAKLGEISVELDLNFASLTRTTQAGNEVQTSLNSFEIELERLAGIIESLRLGWLFRILEYVGNVTVRGDGAQGSAKPGASSR